MGRLVCAPADAGHLVIVRPALGGGSQHRRQNGDHWAIPSVILQWLASASQGWLVFETASLAMSVIRAAIAFGNFARPYEAAVRDLEARIDIQECTGKSYDGVFFPLTTRFESLPSAEVVDAEPELNSSTPVSLAIDYGEHFKVLTDDMAMQQYELTQCSTETPSEAEIDAVKSKPSSVYVRKYFTIPLQVAVAMSTSQLHFLEELDVQDQVAYVSECAVGPCWQMLIRVGRNWSRRGEMP